tara:strand:+ start:376 stop:780 length:405 start_codon:yes stop_codon:yes gene_type:complete
MIKNIKEKLIYFTLMMLCCVGVAAISCPGILKGVECVCEEPISIWYKVSTFGPEKGNIIKLDMSRGKSFTDHEFIYIAVKDLETDELVYVMFPNGGDWVAETPRDEFLDAMEEEFKNLEDYLRSKESQEIKKKQ